MASTSDLIMGDVLFAGSNFKRWMSRMNAVLRLQGLGDYTYANVDRNYRRGDTADRKRALLLLNSPLFVSAAVLSRISARDQKDPYRLWRRLKSQTKPFRFLDLPPELRNSIYESTMDIDTGSYHNVMGESKTSRTTAHPLSQVSRQVRQEALPLYWAVTNARFVFPQHSKPGAINNEIIAWKNAHATHVKYLTECSLTLSFPAISYSKTLHFSFDHKEGLRFESDEGTWKLRPSSLTRVHNYVAGIERDRRANEQQGECLLLALLSEPKLWRYRELEWQR